MSDKPLKIMIPSPHGGTCNLNCPVLYHDPEEGSLCVLGLAHYIKDSYSTCCTVNFKPGPECPQNKGG